MRPRTVEDTEMLQGLMQVLRSKGYDGASLSQLAAATGLKKASLYHRFPGGKKEMTEAVLSFVEQWINEYVVQVLTNPDLKPETRLKQTLKSIDELYESGNQLCLLRSLSTDSGLALFGAQISRCISIWEDAFIQLGISLSLDPIESKQLATQNLVEIQGSLIIAKSMQEPKVFAQTLNQIYQRYFKP